MGSTDYNVFVSRNHKFKYYDEKKANKYGADFMPPTKKVDMKMAEFLKRLREWKRGDDR